MKYDRLKDLTKGFIFGALFGCLGVRHIKKVALLKQMKELTTCSYTKTKVLGELRPLDEGETCVAVEEVNKELMQYVYCVELGDTSLVLASDSEYTNVIFTEDRNELEVVDSYNKDGKLIEQHINIYLSKVNKMTVNSTQKIHTKHKYLGGKLSYASLKALLQPSLKGLKEISLGDVALCPSTLGAVSYTHLYDMLYTTDVDPQGK